MVKEKTQKEDQVSYGSSFGNEIILFNDDDNSFDFIIESLIEVVGHDTIQAEQCTTIAHYNGKCPVKAGDLNELRPIYEEMVNRKIVVELK